MLQQSDLNLYLSLGIFIDGINFKFAYVLLQFYQVKWNGLLMMFI